MEVRDCGGTKKDHGRIVRTGVLPGQGGYPTGGAWDKFAQVQNFLGKFVGENGIWIPEVVLGKN